MNARAFFIRLLHEALDALHPGIDPQRISRVNVTVPGRRMVGRDTESDDFARRRDVARLRAQPSELLSVLKDVVGREDGDDRLRIASRGPDGRRADRGRTVTPLRLK
jgi:hypothetical protein